MKKYLLVFLALLLTAAVVTATVLNSDKKVTAKNKTEKPVKKSGCQRLFKLTCY
ncbi:MAG TPA: hypothetical protein VEY10_11605 [Flavisolibacter sp.]|jgi:archaellin|nr:hypothetical protein [Flavisolibacter sp.]